MSINDVEHCEVVHKHSNVVLKVHREMPDEDKLYDLAELFKVFGDSTRIKILYSLFETELCVSDMASILNLSQSSVSHQLRVLKQSNLVKYRKAGRVIYYSLADEHVRTICRMGMEHVLEDSITV